MEGARTNKTPHKHTHQPHHTSGRRGGWRRRHEKTKGGGLCNTDSAALEEVIGRPPGTATRAPVQARGLQESGRKKARGALRAVPEGAMTRGDRERSGDAREGARKGGRRQLLKAAAGGGGAARRSTMVPSGGGRARASAGWEGLGAWRSARGLARPVFSREVLFRIDTPWGIPSWRALCRGTYAVYSRGLFPK